MATLSRFEDLEIWQLARAQCIRVHELMEDGRFDFDAALADQLNRSSGSVMDNIAKGFDRFTKADFRHFLVIARGSHAEVHSQLYRSLDRSYITEDELHALRKDSVHLSVKISNLISHLYHTEFKNKLPSQNPANTAEPETFYNQTTDDLHDIPDQFINRIEH